ncbi:uncharacterized protein K489DRAFT_119308 [Dissoconium aciculare CBS 342.82]|uniref:Uncharacterized protein n=1 Tax=Dissoconium aciculare CBS 342.82 TaxID=1314786 RepID=A0A6J3MEX9_9PEZI|nr:uncharacterized protein K489DRAFT_119308 [Dissoconium aciculare CBS 342.82]KAF1826561.1 hypothetical protein K489DRAFT_119308 [Dissoconium aciculare CBS 342.82]
MTTKMSPGDEHAKSDLKQHTLKNSSGTSSSNPETPGNVRDRRHAIEYVKNLQAIKKAKDAAQSLREKASTITNAEERNRVLSDAYAKEMEANGLSKLAQRMQSGPWQGFAGGAGIGGAVSLGLGTVVGTLVGGVLSVPMVGLGALVGTGVGAVHGPFIKIGGKEKSWDEANAEDVVDALEQEQNGKTTDGEKVLCSAQAGSNEAEKSSQPERKSSPRHDSSLSTGKKSEQESNNGHIVDAFTQTVERKRPRKLERRPRA